MVYAIVLLSVILISVAFGTKIYLLDPNDKLNRISIVGFVLTALFAFIEYSLLITESSEKANTFGWIHQILILPLLLSYFRITKFYSTRYKSFPSWYNFIINPIYYSCFAILMICQMQEETRMALDPVLFEGSWHYVFNMNSFCFWLFFFWVALTVVSAAFNFYHGYLSAVGKKEKSQRFFLVILFIILPVFIVLVFLFRPTGTNVGNYIVSPFLLLCILGLGLAYTNYQLFQISPLKAFHNIMSSLNAHVAVLNNQFKLVYLNKAGKSFITQKSKVKTSAKLDYEGALKELVENSDLNWKLLRKELKELKYPNNLVKETELILKGEKKHLMLNFSPVYGENEKLGYALVTSDVTEMKQFELQLEQYATELKEKNQELERFAFIASHDLKSPVRNIVSFLGLVKRKIKKHQDQDLEHYIDITIRSARQMYYLVEDVLEFSRLNKNSELHLEVVDSCELINLAIQNLDDIIKEKNAVISLHELPSNINVDPNKIIQLFQNLIENGLKYNVQEQPEINITYSNSGDYHMFSVRDNGIGIDKNYQDSIFEMFKRLHNSEEFEGTGIGLAVCKKIAQLHHGKIWVDSTPGQGSAFQFEIEKM